MKEVKPTEAFPFINHPFPLTTNRLTITEIFYFHIALVFRLHSQETEKEYAENFQLFTQIREAA